MQIMNAITFKKTITFLFFISLFSTSIAQNTVTLTSPSQSFDFTNDSIELDITIKSDGKIKFFNLMVFNDSEKYKDVLDGKSNELGFNEIIAVTKKGESKATIKIPINKKSLKENNGYLSLRLEKKDENQDFEIINNAHTLVFSKKVLPTLAFKAEKETVKIDLSKSTKIEIPFKIISSDLVPKEDDNVLIEIELKGVENLKILDEKKKKKQYKIIGGEYSDKFILDIGDDKKKLSDSLINSNNIRLEITTDDDKKTVAINPKAKQKRIYFREDVNPILKNRYNFYLGTNFDLEDRFEATSFYSEIDAWLPKLINNNWGIRAGIYKNNNSRSLEESSRTESLFETVSTTKDSITFQSKRVQTVPSVKAENFGLYFEALFKLVENKNFTTHLAGHFEVIRRNEKFTFNSTDVLSFAQQTISIDSLSNNRSLQRLLERPRTSTREYYDSYYGLGLPMNYYSTKSKFSIFLNPVIGVGHLGLDLRNREGELVNPTQAFGIFQFSLIQEDVGIKLSGEVRKFFGSIQAPIISVNLSKTISLSGALKSEKKEE